MPRDLKAMFREALDLPESARATLAGLLIESLEPPPDPDVEDLWAEEAERGWREIESGAVETIPWDEVKGETLPPRMTTLRFHPEPDEEPSSVPRPRSSWANGLDAAPATKGRWYRFRRAHHS